ncbi:MAG TPA: ATP synthase F0 subunit B [Candidatus Binataceae bacterium]|nr:ATP synthase F0 subunit B [Candidatus Binataceae bacterium]
MNRRIVIATAATVALWPALALAAEESAGGYGSWHSLAFFVFNFALFVIILVVYVGPFVRNFFADRANSIKSSLTRARDALREAEDLANQAAKRLAGLDHELKNLADELERETAFHLGRIGDTARSTAERIRRDAQLTGSAIAESGQRRIRQRLANSAAGLARDLISRHFQSSDQSRLIDSFSDRLGAEGRR